MKMIWWAIMLVASVLVTTGVAVASPSVPDNGTGTADMPLHLDYDAVSPMYIIDGLPAGTNLTIDAVQTAPTSTVEQLGGTLGGTQAAGIGSGFHWNMQGTGALAGYSRTLFIPFSQNVASFPAPPGAGYEVHAATRRPPRTTYTFDTTMFYTYGQIAGGGDPDFDLLRVTAGSGFGLPSPGQTTLTQLANGDWAVDSFFDITYRIDFVGRPGGPFAGLSGSTTSTVRMEAVPEPSSLALLVTGGILLRRRRSAAHRRPDSLMVVC